MARGPKKHLKTLHAPRTWFLSKNGGIFAPRPNSGPHKLRECVPIAVLLRNRLRYALSYHETKLITRQRVIKVDGRVRTDKKFPIGFMDVVTIDKTNDVFRMLYDTKGRFICHPITKEEASYKLSKVREIRMEHGNRPHAYCTDGRTIRYPHPEIRANDTLKIDLTTGKPVEWVKFQVGALAFTTGGYSQGRIGIITKVENHEGSPDIVHLKDLRGTAFSTRMTNVFVIGMESSSLISLPKNRGIRLSILEEQKYGMTTAETEATGAAATEMKDDAAADSDDE